jgi:hypothetical protein
MRRVIFLLVLTCVVAMAPASAGPVLYDNGPVNGSIEAYTINNGYAVSNSFLLTSASTVTGVSFATWQFSGDTLYTVDWVISSGDVYNGLGTLYGSNTATVTPGAFSTNSLGYVVFDGNTIVIPNLALGAGTYWLTFRNALATNGDWVFWDQNNGPSAAWQNPNPNGRLAGSQTFQILGDAGPAIPEPGAWLLAGGGLALLGLWRRRNRGLTR